MSESRTIVVEQVNLESARHVIESVCDFAAAGGLRVAVVVVDAAGHLVAASRMDGAPFAVLRIAQEKAWTAAAFGTPTTAWRELSQPGGKYWGVLNSSGGRFSALSGGVPLAVDGAVVGAVGVSGEDDVDDDRCARHGAAALRAEWMGTR